MRRFLEKFQIVWELSYPYIPPMKKSGVLISFEGVDGSGKSTQARMLYEHLQKCGIDTLFIREPGGTEVSEAIRAILLDNAHKQMNPRTELLLFLASRAELVDKVIKPALNEGKVVITDRFSDSTLAYQIDGRKVPRDIVVGANAFAADRIKPNLTFIVDLEIAKAHSRLTAERDRMESAAEDFHRRVRKGFLKIAQSEPARVKVVDGRDTQDAIFAQVLAMTTQLLKRRKLGSQKLLAQ